jgi:hypothetical protein
MISPYSENKQFSWLLVSAENREQSKFSEALNLCKNLAVRIDNWSLNGRKLKCRWHLATTAAEFVVKTFIKTLVMAKSIECLSRGSTEHASVEYTYW